MREDESVAIATGLTAVTILSFVLLTLGYFDLSWTAIASVMAFLTLIALGLCGMAKEFFWY